MLSLSVVMPVCDGREFLAQSLPALAGLDVIVVDDGSVDESREFAESFGARVIDSGGRRRGPAVARNIGVEAADSDLVLFVDADVVLHADAVELLLAAFEDPTTTAVYGSYDTAPPAPGFASQYMNLRHHYYHREPLENAGTFWSGLGAVRRQAFQAVGGFDGQTFARPSVEDIDLGSRLRSLGGRIRRMPAVQGTHLKQWSFFGVVHTDIFCRAIPWARMIIQQPGAFTDLNVSRAERLRAALAGAWLLTGVAALLGFVSPWLALAGFGLVLLSNREFFGFFAGVHGPLFALFALLQHQLYYLYSSAVYAGCKLVFRQPSEQRT